MSDGHGLCQGGISMVDSVMCFVVLGPDGLHPDDGRAKYGAAPRRGRETHQESAPIYTLRLLTR